jgi:uncharacterized protein (DUF305 family)
VTNRFWAILAVVAVVAVAGGVGIGAAMWAGGEHGDDAAMSDMDTGMDMDMGTDMSMDGESGLDERSFLEQMVPHHDSAVAMANMALEKSQRPEIRRVAQEIVSAQEREIAQMRAWHREWFGEELTPSETGPHAAMDMAELETATGDAFDAAFLEAMIPHHASAITMAEQVLQGSPRDAVRTVADDIISAQAAEIGQMQEWRDEWFPEE